MLLPRGPFGKILVSPETHNTVHCPKAENFSSSHVGLTTGMGSAAKEHADSNINVVSANDSNLQPTAPHNEGPQHKTQGGKVTPDQHYHQTQPLLLAEQTIHTQIRNQEHSKITTLVKVEVLKRLLLGYQDKKYLIDGFECGFLLGYVGPRNTMVATNLKSCRDHPEIVQSKITAEINANRVKGPFKEIPFPNMKISPIGIVPKKVPGQYRLIHHMSCPEGSSVNDFIDPTLASVKYASFDDAVKILVKLGPYTQMS